MAFYGYTIFYRLRDIIGRKSPCLRRFNPPQSRLDSSQPGSPGPMACKLILKH